MTGFHKLFMVKMNKMIKKKAGGIFLVVYVIYGSLVHTDSKKTSCLLPRLPASYHVIMQLLKGNQNANLYAYSAVYVCSIMSLTIIIGLNVFVCIVQVNNQLDV